MNKKLNIPVKVGDDPKEYYRLSRIERKEEILEYNSSPIRKQKCVERIRKKKLYLANLLGSKCIHCNIESNYENIAIFDFHHIKEKSFNLAPFTRSLKSLIEESKKCILLCANCHRLEHRRIEDEKYLNANQLNIQKIEDGEYYLRNEFFKN